MCSLCAPHTVGPVVVAPAEQAVTAKHAVRGITACAAVEYSHHGIRTNAIAPGYTDTAMMDQAGPGTRDYAAKQTPLGRIGTPEDIGK